MGRQSVAQRLAGGGLGPAVHSLLLGRAVAPRRPHRRGQRSVQYVPPLASLCRLLDSTGATSSVEPLTLFRPAFRRQSPTGAVLSPDVAGVADACHQGIEPGRRAAPVARWCRNVRLAAFRGSVGCGGAVRRGRLCLQRLLLRARICGPSRSHHHRGLAAARVMGLPARREVSLVETCHCGGTAGRAFDPGRAHGLVHLCGADADRLRCLLHLGVLAREAADTPLSILYSPLYILYSPFSIASPHLGGRDAARWVGPGSSTTSADGRVGNALDSTGCVRLRFRRPLFLAAGIPFDLAGA